MSARLLDLASSNSGYSCLLPFFPWFESDFILLPCPHLLKLWPSRWWCHGATQRRSPRWRRRRRGWTSASGFLGARRFSLAATRSQSALCWSSSRCSTMRDLQGLPCLLSSPPPSQPHSPLSSQPLWLLQQSKQWQKLATHPHQVHQQHQTQRQQMRQRQQRQQLRQRQQHHTHCVEAFSPHGKARPGWKLLLVNIQLIQPEKIQQLYFLSRLVAFYSVVYLAILLANIHFIRHTKKKVCVVFW